MTTTINAVSAAYDFEQIEGFQKTTESSNQFADSISTQAVLSSDACGDKEISYEI